MCTTSSFNRTMHLHIMVDWFSLVTKAERTYIIIVEGPAIPRAVVSAQVESLIRKLSPAIYPFETRLDVSCCVREKQVAVLYWNELLGGEAYWMIMVEELCFDVFLSGGGGNRSAEWRLPKISALKTRVDFVDRQSHRRSHSQLRFYTFLWKVKTCKQLRDRAGSGRLKGLNICKLQDICIL